MPVPKPGYPKDFKHLGHHVRARRLDLGLDQRAVAKEIGVARDTLRSWEKGRTEPEVRFLPALIAFVDHNPLPILGTWGQAIRRRRLSLGLSQRRLAVMAGVDEASVRRLESDTKGMARRVRQAVDKILGLGEDQSQGLRAPDRSRARATAQEIQSSDARLL